MSHVAVPPFSGSYRAQPAPSTVAFAVRHSGVFWFRGSLADVAATLRADEDALALDGSGRVDSISIIEPAALLRASVLEINGKGDDPRGCHTPTGCVVPKSTSHRPGGIA